MYEIDEKVLNATLQYLAGRPFAEVADLINVLRQSKKVEPLTDGQVETKKEDAKADKK